MQRGGPSTGLPTKTEQADLLQAMFGRNGESPVPIVAPQSPADCFDAALEAVRIATTYRTPVLLLSDGYLANGSEPWRIPERRPTCPTSTVQFATEPNDTDAKGNPVFHPYLRDPETLARPWAVPGTPGLEHRIGGIEKADVTGNISYDPDNHDHMTRLRQAKVDGIADDHPPTWRSTTRPATPTVLVLGWGSTYGPIAAAVRQVRNTGSTVAQAHLRHLNPFPANTGEVLRALRPGARARDEPRASSPCCCAPSTSSTCSATPRCAGCRSPQRTWPTCSQQAVETSAERVTEGVSR